ncbi:putative glycolipid-binding domain-containing protein [Nocardia sp. NPDC050406]|uniref:putative glycolipid-binding domain-containing protein n=1 Tax=Nocardia sp. NPDC050406 TaxID=3364318 RepID=UPI0037A5D843
MSEPRHLLWQVEESAGFEASWITLNGLALHAEGRAVGQRPEPYWLDYTLDTDEHAVTTRLAVSAATASETYHLNLRRDGDGWFVDGEPRPDLAGARDCDLSFSPLTNTMPIIRTGLHRNPGSERFLMAFIEVPTLEVVASVQHYEHLRTVAAGAEIRFTSGDFTSDIVVDGQGLVEVYPTMARRVPTANGPRT